MLTFTVTTKEKNLNLKTFLAQKNISAHAYKKLKAAGLCKVNNIPQARNLLLQPGDIVALELLAEDTTLKGINKPLAISYEDACLLVVNKPAGVLVHPTTRVEESLANYVVHYYHATSQNCGIHPISRLDKETSGLVLFAKNALFHHMLTNVPLVKEYVGLVHGTPKPLTGEIIAPLARKPDSIIEREVNFTQGKEARTSYQVLATNGVYSLLHFLLHTGRTHQIRVHMAHTGHPLVNDNLYGKPGPPQRHFLHAYRLTFKHPLTNEEIICTAPLPEDMTSFLDEQKICYNMVIKNFRR